MRGIIITGRLATGIGLGRTFTRLEWARHQFMDRLGIDPYPGTVNVIVSEPNDLALWERLKATAGVHIDNPNDGPHDCDARCYRVALLKADCTQISAAIVLPELAGYPANQIEVICAIGLRDALGVRDGDILRLDVVP
jgi:CTP-dependent riboflavin kinase